MSESVTRIYVVRPTGTHTHQAKDAKPRMVKAKNALGALKYATKDFYEVEICGSVEAVELACGGVKVEDATAEAEE